LLQWGVDLKEFDVPLSEKSRQRFRGDAEFVFISTRRLRPLYNVGTILNAYARVFPSVPKSRLIIVGDDEQRPALEEQARKLHIHNQVCFTGWLSREELIQALLCSDAYISIPSSDSTAVSLLEAFAARLPVIASDLPANHEWIETGENGYLIQAADTVKLTQAMIRLFDHREQSQQWGVQNRKIVEERGNRELEMAKLEGWYREFTEKK
jgi:glycosyltransferase involved in cell wall biosynthesis